MNRRRSARKIAPAAPAATLQGLLDRSPNARLPLDVAVQVAHELAAAVGREHEAGRVVGGLDAAAVLVHADGRLELSTTAGGHRAPELAHGWQPTVASDVYALGAVLYQVFSGLTPAQARARQAVPRLHQVPPPSRFNPALDDGLDALVLTMLAAEPSDRPVSLRIVEGRILGAFTELGLEPTRDEVARWAALRTAQKPVLMVAPAPAPRPAAQVRRPLPVWHDEDEEEVLSMEAVAAWAEPLRLDVWAFAAVAFSAVALVMALTM